MPEPTALPEPTAMPEQSATLFDERTVIVPAGIDVTGASALTTHTPTDAQVEAVLGTIASAPELEWAREHTRFVSGRNDDGAVTIVVDLACDIEPVDGDDAVEAMQNLSTVGGGGDCYGFAVFSDSGELLRSGTNGES